MKQAMIPHERLIVTLGYLVSGCTYEDLKFPTAISPQVLGKIIPDTCKAILQSLQEKIKVTKFNIKHIIKFQVLSKIEKKNVSTTFYTDACT